MKHNNYCPQGSEGQFWAAPCCCRMLTAAETALMQAIRNKLLDRKFVGLDEHMAEHGCENDLSCKFDEQVTFDELERILFQVTAERISK